MNTIVKSTLLGAVALLIANAPASAESELDEALANGGKRLSSSEIAEKFVGKTVKAQSGEKTFLFFYNAENVLSGKLANGGWEGAGFYGITDDNQICVSMKPDKGRLRCLTVVQGEGAIKKFNVAGKMTFELLEFQDGNQL